jgi:hypothetical protein
MPFVPFHDFYPELADRETRTVMLPEEIGGLPADDYSFLELYCDDRGCDCRRVMFMVVSQQHPKPLAVVAYGWESLEFYARWAKFGGPKVAKELQGPVLNMGSPQTKFAPAVLDLTEAVVLQDPLYVERLKRHYRMVRDIVDRRGPDVTQRLDPREKKRLMAHKTRELQARRSLRKRSR